MLGLSQVKSPSNFDTFRKIVILLPRIRMATEMASNLYGCFCSVLWSKLKMHDNFLTCETVHGGKWITSMEKRVKRIYLSKMK